MARKTRPSTVASQLDYDWEPIMQWSADLMEDANFHGISGALEALAYEDHDTAIEFLQLDKEHHEEGSLTRELMDRRLDLYDKLREHQGKPPLPR